MPLAGIMRSAKIPGALSFNAPAYLSLLSGSKARDGEPSLAFCSSDQQKIPAFTFAASETPHV